MSRDTASLCCPDVEDWCCTLGKTTTAVETAPAHTGILAPLNGFLRAGSRRGDFWIQRIDCPGKCLSKLQQSHRWGMRVQGPSPASSVTDTWTVSVVTSGGWWPSEGGEGEVSSDSITIFNGKGHINVGLCSSPHLWLSYSSTLFLGGSLQLCVWVRSVHVHGPLPIAPGG